MIQIVYNKIRPYLLHYDTFTTWQILHSVPVRNACVFDQGLVNLDYKPGLATSVTEYIIPGDSVIEVGGGRGVITVLAAREGADVLTFEPAREMRELLYETISVSMVQDNVTIRPDLVGSIHDIYYVENDGYGVVDGRIVPPDELPECDVLLMDCEGGEEQIIHEMTINPDRVIYESHPHRANPHELNSLLGQRGYGVIAHQLVQPDSTRAVYVLEKQ